MSTSKTAHGAKEYCKLMQNAHRGKILRDTKLLVHWTTSKNLVNKN